jgi:hypothetical protein
MIELSATERGLSLPEYASRAFTQGLRPHILSPYKDYLPYRGGGASVECRAGTRVSSLMTLPHGVGEG